MGNGRFEIAHVAPCTRSQAQVRDLHWSFSQSFIFGTQPTNNGKLLDGFGSGLADHPNSKGRRPHY
jgi:hypothetical protein